jgi:hypothetical protein
MVETLLDTRILAKGTESPRAVSHSFLVVTFFTAEADANLGLLDEIYFLILNFIECDVVQNKHNNRRSDIVITAALDAFGLQDAFDSKLCERINDQEYAPQDKL